MGWGQYEDFNHVPIYLLNKSANILGTDFPVVQEGMRALPPNSPLTWDEQTND